MVLEAVEGFTIIACASGQEALSSVPRPWLTCCCSMSSMPGMVEPSTLKALRELPATAHTPVIFMTAKVQTAEVAQYMGLGALQAIPKPFDPMELYAQIWRILGMQAQG